MALNDEQNAAIARLKSMPRNDFCTPLEHILFGSNLPPGAHPKNDVILVAQKLNLTEADIYYINTIYRGGGKRLTIFPEQIRFPQQFVERLGYGIAQAAITLPPVNYDGSCTLGEVVGLIDFGGIYHSLDESNTGSIVLASADVEKKLKQSYERYD